MPAASAAHARSVVTPAQEVAAGVLAGVVDALACHPVDSIKTQFHVNTGANGGLAAALAAQARAGGLRSLYRGILPACLRPQALCMYTGNEWAKARRRRAARAVGGRARR
jgi:solute carrier family 25 2-oxodicarboxylate transporter 21